VVLGAVLWTIGLFTVAGVAMTFIILHVPDAARTFHRPFKHTLPALLVALGCMLWGLAEVRRGLLPIERLRARLWPCARAVEARVAGGYPSEVQPLVSDLNALLDQRARGDARPGQGRRPRPWAQDALAVLAQEAERTAAAGHTELAALLRQQVERMRGQVDYHLAQAGAAAGATATAHCFVHESAAGLARTLLRLHAERGLAIDVAVDPQHAIRGRREDLDEMLGNPLDNARSGRGPACASAGARWTRASCSRSTTTAPARSRAARAGAATRRPRRRGRAGHRHRPRDRARSRRALRRTQHSSARPPAACAPSSGFPLAPGATSATQAEHQARVDRIAAGLLAVHREPAGERLVHLEPHAELPRLRRGAHGCGGKRRRDEIAVRARLVEVAVPLRVPDSRPRWSAGSSGSSKAPAATPFTTTRTALG
jgi:hypothetical protein